MNDDDWMWEDPEEALMAIESSDDGMTIDQAVARIETYVALARSRGVNLSITPDEMDKLAAGVKELALEYASQSAELKAKDETIRGIEGNLFECRERIAELERKRSAALQDLDEARSRLVSYRERSIQRGVTGSSCRLCFGQWAHSRGEGEMHEADCPNATAVEGQCPFREFENTENCMLTRGHEGPCSWDDGKFKWQSVAPVVEEHAHNWTEREGDTQNLYCECGEISRPLSAVEKLRPCRCNLNEGGVGCEGAETFYPDIYCRKERVESGTFTP